MQWIAQERIKAMSWQYFSEKREETPDLLYENLSYWRTVICRWSVQKRFYIMRREDSITSTPGPCRYDVFCKQTFTGSEDLCIENVSLLTAVQYAIERLQKG